MKTPMASGQQILQGLCSGFKSIPSILTREDREPRIHRGCRQEVCKHNQDTKPLVGLRQHGFSFVLQSAPTTSPWALSPALSPPTR